MKSIKDGVKFEGVTGTWGQVDKEKYNGKVYYLFENEQEGDEIPYIITDAKMNIVVLNSYNGIECELNDLGL